MNDCWLGAIRYRLGALRDIDDISELVADPSLLEVFKLRGLERCLITLSRGQNVHSLFISKLRQALGIHWATTLLFGFKSLTGVARIENEQKTLDVDSLNCSFDLEIGDAVLENCLNSLCVDACSRSAITKVMRH